MTDLSVEESIDLNMSLSSTNLSLSNSESYGDFSISIDCQNDDCCRWYDTPSNPPPSHNGPISDDEYWCTDERYKSYSSEQQRRRRRNLRKSQSAPLHYKSKKRRLCTTDSPKTPSLVESLSKKHQRIQTSTTILPPIPQSLRQFSNSTSM